MPHPSTPEEIPGQATGESPDTERLGGTGIVLDRLAHELRTPLAAIQSMAEALSEGHLGRLENERHVGYVRSMAETARHALAVVDAMLARSGAFGERPAEAPVVLDLEAICREVATGMAMLAARSGVRLHFVDGLAPVTAFARPTDVRQMLINLASNGVAHAGGGSTVRITIGSAGGASWFEVVDDGAGIADCIIARVQAGEALHDGAEAARDGRMRLGLTLTRALAEANGGRLEIRSGAEGTCVRIVLPAPA